ncbi:DsrH/TusB family sulfur metabolism protein [Glaesserella parasuis]|nr:DsrH/TusB family sulfur metabolism protein [Glaesserella parasuis]MDP0119207.1 DsrH/TusB family sulfur metabolism protein [Glaesserella parasuis]
MLYTFSKAQYDLSTLNAILEQVTPDDAIVLWQDGVLQAVKYPQLFTNKTVFVLQNDIEARGLTTTLPTTSLAMLVQLTEKYYPQAYI